MARYYLNIRIADTKIEWWLGEEGLDNAMRFIEKYFDEIKSARLYRYEGRKRKLIKVIK